MTGHTKFFLPSLVTCILLSSTAMAQDSRWSLSGHYEEIVAVDCTNCEEEKSIVIACQGNGLPAKVTVEAAASQFGQNGAIAPIIFYVDDKFYRYDAQTVEYGLIGFTPEFLLQPNDPLINALRAGRETTVEFNGQRSTIGLKGSGDALLIFAAHCGWTKPGYEQNLARQQAAAQQQNSGGGVQQPVLQQPSQQQASSQQPDLQQSQPALQQPSLQSPLGGQTGGGAQQPILQPNFAQPSVGSGSSTGSAAPQVSSSAGSSQQPLIAQPQTSAGQGQQQVQLQTQPMQQNEHLLLPNASQTVLTRTQPVPNEDGAYWATGNGQGGGSPKRLFFGIPETDAVLLSASCENNDPRGIELIYFGDNGGVPDGAAVQLTIQHVWGQAKYDGTVFNHNEESAGAVFYVPRADPVWSAMAASPQILFGYRHLGAIPVSGISGAPALNEFAQLCSGQ